MSQKNMIKQPDFCWRHFKKIDNLSVLRGPFIINSLLYIMKTKKSKTQPRELTISTAELSRFGVGVMNKALKVVNTAKKGKITIRVEKV